MDLAKTLIRKVARGFYETRHILVIDALFIHSALHPDDLAFLLGMQPKDLRKLCGKLREDRLLAVHSRQETRDNNPRPISRDYYYIPLHTAIDSIKYRIYHLQDQVNAQYKQDPSEKKDYYCPRPGCGAKWTQMEVLSSFDPDLGFICQRCNGLLEQEKENPNNKGGHEKLSRLMEQIQPLLSLLQEIDKSIIPANEFEDAIAHAVPVVRDDGRQPRTVTIFNPSDAKTSSKKSSTQTDESRLEISLTTNSERSAADEAAEAKRKAAIATQNALPVWHTNSTVTGEAIVDKASTMDLLPTSAISATSVASAKTGVSTPEESKANVKNDAVMEEYYKEMEQQARLAMQKEAEEEEDEEEDEDDEDEDEFVDVSLPVPQSATMSDVEATITAESAVLQVKEETKLEIKLEAESQIHLEVQSEPKLLSNGMKFAVMTPPSSSGGTLKRASDDEAEERNSKRAKVENLPGESNKDEVEDEEDDENEEFENAL